MIDMSQLYNDADYPAVLSAFNTSRRWSVFKSIHLKISKNRCPICECRLDGTVTRNTNNSDNLYAIEPTIDHYRPKDTSLYPFLKFVDTNYILMCSDCNNAYKGNKFPLHNSTPNRATSIALLVNEKPLIVNPISDVLLDLFTVVFRYTPSGKKVLELQPKNYQGYEYEKAEETIKVFSLGGCEINVHENLNVQNCRINLLNDHFRKFEGFIQAFRSRNMVKMRSEIELYNLQEYGFLKFILEEQYKDLVSMPS